MSIPDKTNAEPDVIRWSIRTNGAWDIFTTLFVGTLAAIPLVFGDAIGKLAAAPFAFFFLRCGWGLLFPREYELVLRDGVLYSGWSGEGAAKWLALSEVIEFVWDEGTPYAKSGRTVVLQDLCAAVLCRGRNLESFVRVMREKYPGIPFRNFPESVMK